MKTKLSPYYERIPDVEKIRFGDDYFQHKEFADNLTRLLEKSEDSLVMTVNAGWGEGKTTFIKLWEHQLKVVSQMIPIYYDAFENDFTRNVFVSIAVAIQDAMEEHLDLGDGKRKQLKEKGLNLGKELVKVGSNTAVKYASGGVINIKGVLESLESEILTEDIYDAQIKDQFDAYEGMKEAISDYQEKLTEILKAEESQGKKIVFFIDELDRCRPTFAVEVIEKIKHFFDMPNVHFVLSINKDQLVKTIKSAYGVEEDDAHIYLQKFIHVETNLPEMKMFSGEDARRIKEFISDITSELRLENKDEVDDCMYKLTTHLMDDSKLKLTPRSIERILTLLAVVLSGSTENQREKLLKHMVLLAFLKVKSKRRYEALKTERINESVWQNKQAGEENLGKLNEWLKKNYFVKDDLADTGSSTDIKVPGLKEAARLLEMFKLPNEKEYKGPLGWEGP